jgi:hypothetical protein
MENVINVFCLTFEEKADPNVVKAENKVSD